MHRLLIDRVNYMIAAIEPEGIEPESFHDLSFVPPIFDPAYFGFHPVMYNTAMYSGYFCKYAAYKGFLVLKDLHIHDPEKIGVAINGCRPKQDDFSGQVYRGLYIIMETFSGQLIVGDGLIRELYINMGYQAPDAFERVKQVSVNNGKIERVMDLSEYYSRRRGGFKRQFHNGDGVSSESILRAFSLRRNKSL